VCSRRKSDGIGRPLKLIVSWRNQSEALHMRHTFAFGLLLLASTSAQSGPIAEQFAYGYNGVRWGLPLADLVGMMPQGDHYFSTAPGERVYTLRTDDPLFGVPRIGMRVQYHLGKDGGVEYIAVGIPYERHEELIGALISQFGVYSAKRDIGAARAFIWKPDQGIRMVVRISKDPRYGIAEFWVSHTPEPTAKELGK
jgi:hypothetical protein